MESMSLDNIPDPNKSQNRVPFGVELATLRMIRAQKQQLAANIANQLSTAREVHDGIQARYNRLLREMEAIHSELTVSSNYIGTLEKQQQILKEEEDELAGLLHPIRRCSEDILRTIFEHATRKRSFQNATTISHVCKSWRAVALSMGSLWKHITFSAQDDIEDAEMFMERNSVRTRSLPLKVDIVDIGDEPVEETQALIECLKLDQFETIEYVYFVLTSSKDITHISPVTVNNSLASTKCVWITSKSRSDEPPVWDCVWLLKQPKIEHLELHNLGPVLLTGNDPIPSLHEFHLIDTVMPTLSLQLSRLAELIDLTVTGDFRMDNVSQDINMSKLLTLKVQTVKNFPWDRLTAPQLREISTNDKNSRMLPFFRRHPSICDLRYRHRINAEGFNNIAIHLVNVEKLYIAGRIEGLFRQIDPQVPFPPFPKLTDLTVDLVGDFSLSSHDVEDFLKMRCLRSRLKEQSDISLVTRWNICGEASVLEDAPWRKSPLLENCQQTLKKGSSTSWATLYLLWSSP